LAATALPESWCRHRCDWRKGYATQLASKNTEQKVAPFTAPQCPEGNPPFTLQSNRAALGVEVERTCREVFSRGSEIGPGIISGQSQPTYSGKNRQAIRGLGDRNFSYCHQQTSGNEETSSNQEWKSKKRRREVKVARFYLFPIDAIHRKSRPHASKWNKENSFPRTSHCPCTKTIWQGFIPSTSRRRSQIRTTCRAAICNFRKAKGSSACATKRQIS